MLLNAELVTRGIVGQPEGARTAKSYLPSDVRNCYLRSKAITSSVFPNIYRLFLSPPEHNLCLDCASKDPNPNKKGNPCKTEA